MALFKSLLNNCDAPPMGPPPDASDESEVHPQEQTSLASFPIANEHTTHPTNLHSYPDPPPSADRARQLLGAIHEEIDLPSLVTNGLKSSPLEAIGVRVNPNMSATYGHDIPGFPLGILVLGTAFIAVPGTQMAASVCTTVTSAANKTSSAVRGLSQLSKSFRGVGDAADISGGWVDLGDEFQYVATSESH